MKKRFVLVLHLVLIVAAMLLLQWLRLGNHDAKYIDGTVSDVSQYATGTPILNDDRAFIFKSASGSFKIPYDEVDSLEYGKSPGRSLGLHVLSSREHGLFSFTRSLRPKYKQYLAVGYTDENNRQQAVVLQFGDSMIRPALRAFETKTGKKIVYQDDEARESAEETAQ